MTTTELLALFRFEVADAQTPYLWSDDVVYGYIDEAQKQFCRDAYGIADARRFSLKLKVGVEWYALDPSILKIRGTLNTTDGYPLQLTPLEKMAALGMRFDGMSGRPKALITGMEKGYLRCWPVPFGTTASTTRANLTAYAAGAIITLTATNGTTRYYLCSVGGTTAAAQGSLYPGLANETVVDGTATFVDYTDSYSNTVNLHVFRLPDEVVAGDDFEIDAQHVRNLLLWVKYRAYNVQDTEVYNPRLAGENLISFKQYCARALDEHSRLSHSAGSVIYGGL